MSFLHPLIFDQMKTGQVWIHGSPHYSTQEETILIYERTVNKVRYVVLDAKGIGSRHVGEVDWMIRYESTNSPAWSRVV